MEYTLSLTHTELTIGHLAVLPPEDVDLAAARSWLAEHPLDEFMHRHAARLLAGLPEAELKKLFDATLAKEPALASCLAELALSRPGLGSFLDHAAALAAHSPLPDLAALALPGREAHRAWMARFRESVMTCAPLPAPGDEAAWPVSRAALAVRPAARPLAEFFDGRVERPKGKRRPPEPRKVADMAEKALAKAGVEVSPQARHTSSLAPVGLMRQWRMRVAVESSGLAYTLAGTHTAWGRGTAFDPAWAAIVMEIVERASAWTGFDPKGAAGRRGGTLAKARRSELKKPSLDPNALALEAPYADAPLYWMDAEDPAGRKFLVPAQLAYMFVNLDEPALFSAHGSTGLGAGLDPGRARLTALLEVLERDAEAVSPYDPNRLFRLESRDPQVAGLLAEYRAKGVDPVLRDLTTDLGVPCYQCFVRGTEGQLVRGCSAHLSGPKAALSSLLETPYPFPFGPPSQPGPEGLPTRVLEDLPDYSTTDVDADLAILETCLAANHITPLYADLTRKDLRMPVVRAIVPGLEWASDFDSSARVSARLWGAYVRMWE
jgi:ribosomal protein S12 methylthiotransferase accessory factor YcaO